MTFPHCDINDLEGLLWVHVSLLSLCGIVVLASFNSQFKSPAPYGRHADPVKAKAWGFPVPQRIAHMASDAIPGLLICLLVYLLYAGLLPPGGDFSEVRAINVVLLCGWLLHYLYRGIIHPLVSVYSSPTVSVGIPLAGFFPNTIFSYLIAAQLACTVYPSDWAAGPRFIIGVVLYVIGTAINRWADLKLRAGRLAMRRRRRDGGSGQQHTNAGAQSGAQSPPSGARVAGAMAVVARQGDSTAGAIKESLLPKSGDEDGDSVEAGDGLAAGPGAAPGAPPKAGRQPGGAGGAGGGAGDVRSDYFVPRGGLYEWVSCPNYLGELIEWTGYAVAVWSWPALAWVLFAAATFIPRSLTHHRWYKEHFGEEYPVGRRALIPFIL